MREAQLMPWAKLDDHFPSHPKVIKAGGDAAWLFVCAVCYCAEHLTDGVFPKALVPRLSDREDSELLAKRLVENGLWDETQDGDEFIVHDYLDWNPSRVEIQEQRDRRAAASRKANGARWGSRNGSDSESDPDPGCDAQEQVITDPPVPVPPLDLKIQERASTKRKKGTRIPIPFDVTETMAAWAATPDGAPGVNWDRETHKFVDYWRSKPGVAGVKLDWPATWRNWMRTASERVNR